MDAVDVALCVLVGLGLLFAAVVEALMLAQAFRAARDWWRRGP